jgi:hypothetical protein
MEDIQGADLGASSLTNDIDTSNSENLNAENTQAQEAFKWGDIGLDPKADKRFETMWKHPTDLFKSLKEMERSTEKNNQSLNQYKKQVEELNNVQSEYSQIKNYIEMLEKDPVYGQQLKQIIESFNGNIKKQKYGADVPDELIQRLEHLEGKDKALAEQQKLEQETKEWKTTFSGMEEWAKKYDVDFSQETQQEFVNFLFQYQEKLGRNVTPIEAKALFYEVATPQVFEKSKISGQQIAIKNIKNNSLSSALTGNKNTTKIEPKRDATKMSFTDYFNSRG